jgi:hypothetical protein
VTALIHQSAKLSRPLRPFPVPRILEAMFCCVFLVLVGWRLFRLARWLTIKALLCFLTVALFVLRRLGTFTGLPEIPQAAR